MAAVLAPYWQVGKRSFRRYSTYRGATFAGVFTNSVFGFIQAYILLAVMRQRPSIGGFDTVDVVTFVFVSQGFLATIGLGGEVELADRIRTGAVVTDLYRPLHFLGYWWANDMGQAAFQVIGRGIPPVLIGALFFHLRLPTDPAIWLVFAGSVALAVTISFAYRFMISLTTFWLLDVRGVWQLATVFAWICSGFLVPLAFYPAGIHRLLGWTPFPSMVQLPIEVFLGKHRGVGASASVLGVQLVWMAVVIALAEVIAARAMRKVVVQGG